MWPAPAGAAFPTFHALTHNIEYNDTASIINSIDEETSEDRRPSALAAQEVCEGSQLGAPLLARGYQLEIVTVDSDNDNCGAGTVALRNLSAVYGSELDTVSLQYSHQHSGDTGNGHYRKAVCSRGADGSEGFWSCSSHLTAYSDNTALQQLEELYDWLLGSPFQTRARIVGADMNLLPNQLDDLQGNEWDNLFVEADESSSPQQSTSNSGKIDYIFASDTYVNSIYGVGEVECGGSSDHCLLHGAFQWS
jgi:hypothetical protein